MVLSTPLGRTTLPRQAPRLRTRLLRTGSAPHTVKWARRYAHRLLLGDVIAATVAAVGAHSARLGSLESRLTSNAEHVPYLSLTLAVLLTWVVVLGWTGSRDHEVIGFGVDEYKRVIHATVGVFGCLAIGSFVLSSDLPRSYVLIMMPGGLIALLVNRLLFRRWLYRRRENNLYLTDVLAVGDEHTVRDLIRDLSRAPHAGYRVVGACIDSGQRIGNDEPVVSIGGVPVLGGLAEVAAVAARIKADCVAVTSSSAYGAAAVRQLSWDLYETAELILAPALTNIAGPRIHTQPVAGLPLIHVDRPTYRGASRILKKSFDVAGSVLLLLFLSPVLLGLAALVKASSSGPIFFRQERVGITGRRFKMIKFRSMVVDAEERRAALLAEYPELGQDLMFKMKKDPRVTRVGRLLRRFSLDELPQLFNVLAGSMSLVGPRPPLSSEVELYGDEAHRRLLVKPGMTGLWQVSGRSDLTWDDTVRLDVYYVENWSITADLAILWKTVRAVFAHSGAY